MFTNFSNMWQELFEQTLLFVAQNESEQSCTYCGSKQCIFLHTFCPSRFKSSSVWKLSDFKQIDAKQWHEQTRSLILVWCLSTFPTSHKQEMYEHIYIIYFLCNSKQVMFANFPDFEVWTNNIRSGLWFYVQM